MFLNQVQMFKHTVIKMCLRDMQQILHLYYFILLLHYY